MTRVLSVAGYIKLSNQWNRIRDKAINYHQEYYKKKYSNSVIYTLYDVYIDITSKKEISQRPEMLRLLRDCSSGKIDCIAAQTKGYLAANTKEFCYLIKFIFDMDYFIDIITEDDIYNINTFNNQDRQREALYQMAAQYIDLNPDGFIIWKEKIIKEINAIS